MSMRSPRGRSPIPSHPDLAPSRSMRSRSRQSSQRSFSRSPSPGRRDRRSRTRSRSRSSSRGRSGRRHRSPSYSRSPSRDLSPPRSAKIVVEKLTKNVTEAHLREIFGSFGDIEHLDLPMNRTFMTNRGTAYIIYYDPADAEAAIAHMHEAQLDGAVLNVSIILPRRAFSRSPPPVANRGNGGRPKFGKGSFASPPRRQQGRARPAERHDTYRPPSRSRSPRRSPSYSRSRSPPRRGSTRPDSPRQRRRRSPSYSSYSYSSRSDRSRSPVRNRSRSRR